MPLDGPFEGEHRLQSFAGQPVPYRPSPNRGGWMTPRYLVLHYTAGANSASSIDYLCNPSSRVSAHVVVARDGSITQLVPFNRVAWHAGQSRWNGKSGLNRHSIGIELDNRGALEKRNGVWRSWFGDPVPESQVIEARHKNEDRLTGWHAYTPAQLATTLALGRLLVQAYGLEEVIGHDDISPGRKRDPGPALPLASLASAMMQPREQPEGPTSLRADSPEALVQTAAALNIRSGPGLQHAPLRAALAPGTALRVIDRRDAWRQVEVYDPELAAPLTGWVHGDYLTA